MALGLLAIAAAPACRPRPRVVVDAPVHGSFTTADRVEVEGRVIDIAPHAAELQINGSPVEVLADGRFRTLVDLDAERIFQPIHARVSQRGTGIVRRARVTLIRGVALATGAAASPGVALRFGEGGLARLGAAAGTEVAHSIDLAAQLTSANPVAEERICLIPSPFGCLQEIDVEVDVVRAALGAVEMHNDARDGQLRVELVLRELELEYQTRGVDCRGRLSASRVRVPSSYRLTPDPLDTARIDAVLVPGSLSVDLDLFFHEFTGGLCDAPFVSDVADLALGSMDDLLSDGLREGLADPDGDGPLDSPIADGLEAGLDPGLLLESLGDGLGGELMTGIDEVVVDPDGLTLVLEAALADVAGCSSPPDAPVLSGSLWLPSAVPGFGPTTPQGIPYDAALGLSETTFNQLLATTTSCGRLGAELDTLDLGGEELPLDAGALGILLPELRRLPPETPLRLAVRPTLAPVLSGRPGPQGETAELRIAHMLVSLFQADTDPGQLLIELAIDLRAGLQISLDADASAIGLGLGSLSSEHFEVAVLQDRLRVDEAALSANLAGLAPLLLPALGIDFGPLPLPDLGELTFEGREVARQSGLLTLYFDLAAQPADGGDPDRVLIRGGAPPL